MQTALEIAEQVAFDRGVAVRTLQKAFRRTSDALIRQRGVLGEDECDRLMDRLQAWQTLVWDISRAMRKTLPVRKISW